MRRLRTCNRRRRAAILRRAPRKVLQAWEAYVDDFDNRRVQLVMADLARPGEEREIGDFPRRLFRHVPLACGLILTVEVLASRRIEIRTVPRSPGAGNAGAELAGLLATLREEEQRRPEG